MPSPATTAAPLGLAAPLDHLRHLDGLRAVAALFVVLHHLVFQVIMYAPLPPSWVPLFGPLFHGHEAVDLFIVLSGFCLMLPVLRNGGRMRPSAGRFFLQRTRRILPPYYLAVLLSLGLVLVLIHRRTGTIWDAALPVTGKSVWSHLLLIHDAVGEQSTINYVFWSIAVEWRIYFLFPLLVWGWQWAGPVATTVCAVAVSYVAYRVCQRVFGFTLSLHYVGLFTMGMLGATVAQALPGQPLHGWKSRVPWGWLAAFTAVLVLSFDHARLYRGHVPAVGEADVIVGFGVMSLLILTTTGQGWARTILSRRPLVFAGTFAYSIYLVHAPLLQALWQCCPASLQRRPFVMLAVLFVVGLPLVIGVSYGFFLACERPFLTRKKTSGLEPLVTETILKPAP